MFNSVFLLMVVVLVVLLTIVESVQFFTHPVPIPQSINGVGVNRGYYRSGRKVGGATGGNFDQRNSLSSENDPAVQFLINNDEDGSYHFGYDTGGLSHHYKEEIRDKSGRIYGRFGYLDPEGFLRITEYRADEEGFRSTESKRLVFDTSELQLIGPIPKPSASGGGDGKTFWK